MKIYGDLQGQKPTLVTLNEELKDLVDWERLAQHVPDITDEVTQSIKTWSSSPTTQKRNFLKYWLSYYPKLTWADVIDVLMKGGEYKLAAKVNDHFNTKV